MTNETIVDEMNDPLSNAIFNEGLDWAATWLETYIPGATPEVAEFARNMAESIRAAKRPVEFQQRFAEVIRNDPYMDAANKRYWLGLVGDIATITASQVRPDFHVDYDEASGK